MAASTNDLFKKVGDATVTTLAAPGKALGATSITVGATTNYPTDTGVIIAIRVVDTSGTVVDGTYTEFSGTITSGTTIGIVATPVYGSDQVYAAGSTTQVYIGLSKYGYNTLIDGILVSHKQDGTLNDGVVSTTAKLADGIITKAKQDTAAQLAIDTGWNLNTSTTTVPAPNTVTYNGQRSYNMVFNSVDLTNYLNPGTRLRTTRTVAAPTQCTSLNGTTQYYSKTTPAGMTFTDDFTCSGWIKLASYPATNGNIISRWNGTSGFKFQIVSTGQLMLVGTNGGSGNFSYVQSAQSIPLNKWVHVSAQIDMSTFTASTTTSYIMLDGVDVPVTVARAGTNPTALVQAGNLEIGSANATEFFPGKIAQAAVFSAKVTQATILASMNQGLAGTETSLISAYSFNNSINDLNANANNLTANGSAVATNADSPFGTQASGLISSTLDYGIVQSATFSTNTTVVVQVPEGCTIPTSGGVSAVSYSGQKAPYGFPNITGRWRISTQLLTTVSTTSNASYGAFNSGGYKLTIPIGAWDIGHRAGGLFNSSTTAVWFNISPTDLTGLTATAGSLASPYNVRITSAAASATVVPYYISAPQLLSTQQSYVMYTVGATTAGGIAGGDTGPAEIFATNGLL